MSVAKNGPAYFQQLLFLQGAILMPTSPTTYKWLRRPDNPERSSLDGEAFMRARNQSLAHQMILAEFKRTGMSQAELAKRTGKGTDVISRLIGRPGNWTLNTISDLLY